ncbi:Glycosylhydrolase family 18-1 [Tolypocladium paradoxum]|uniref:Glycosylhydrolase family 18-1 n=1 Tax=Tolypocladium paradoxum TaxID=94208 RepID=A0A2S4KLV3_9HYPO|nr:Glycosylhydrolase family 18-1 [Tolypocladium paradoxum]
MQSFPDASQPLDVCRELDSGSNFTTMESATLRNLDLSGRSRTGLRGIGKAKVFIGTLASSADGDQGYVDANTLVGAIQGVKNMNLPNYSSATLWEAQLALKNGN